jgi:hypothetical protein
MRRDAAKAHRKPLRGLGSPLGKPINEHADVDLTSPSSLGGYCAESGKAGQKLFTTWFR